MSLKLESRSAVRLTKSEALVLQMVADGLAGKEIAATLMVSLGTVNFHLGSVYRKLGARNRIDAVRQATRHGFVTWN